jgi:hypothetical protein
VKTASPAHSVDASIASRFHTVRFWRRPWYASFQIWIMPADYTPIPPDTTAQFEEARLLGSNQAVAVYCASFTTGTPSWKTWREDLTKHLRLTKDKSPKRV